MTNEQAIGLELDKIDQSTATIRKLISAAPPVPPDPPLPISRVLFGATYSQPTLPAVKQYKVQAVPFYGWGTALGAVDARIGEMAGASYRVLTACSAPANMKPSGQGDTQTGLEDRVALGSHQAYADLIAATVLRNPSLTHVQVWNEYKGYWSSQKNRWNYEEETDLYNRVYRAVKAVRPSVQVGGPYIAFTKWLPGTGSNKAADASLNGLWGDADQRDFDVLDYFFRNAAGFDFVTVDANLGCRPYQANGSLSDAPGSALQAAGFFAAVAKWVRGKGVNAPVWWSECYPYARGQVLWSQVAASLTSVPGEHVLMWWAESPYPAPPVL